MNFLQEIEGTENSPNALVFVKSECIVGLSFIGLFSPFSSYSGLDNLDHQLLALLSSPTRHAAPSPFHRHGRQKSC
jgi:hypothetical protein